MLFARKGVVEHHHCDGFAAGVGVLLSGIGLDLLFFFFFSLVWQDLFWRSRNLAVIEGGGKSGLDNVVLLRRAKAGVVTGIGYGLIGWQPAGGGRERHRRGLLHRGISTKGERDSTVATVVQVD